MLNPPMQASQNGLHLTEQFEGCRLTPYLDIGGVPTDGYGNTHGVVMGTDITLEKAQLDLQANYQNSQNEVNRIVNVQLTQGEFDALCDFAFNLGNGNLEKSTLLKDVNASNFEAAANQFEVWDLCNGKVVAGLLRRRVAEKAEFQSVS